MKIEKEFIPYEQALELKKLGFNDECFAGYDIYTKELYIGYENSQRTFNIEYYILAPTFSQAFRWFREKYDLHYIVCKNVQIDGYGYREVIQIPYMEENENIILKTYEEAELECLKKLIEIVKNGKK